MSLMYSQSGAASLQQHFDFEFPNMESMCVPHMDIIEPVLIKSEWTNEDQFLQWSSRAPSTPSSTSSMEVPTQEMNYEEDDTKSIAASSQNNEDYRPVISYDNVNTFYDLSDEQIANIDFKELTRLMSEAGLSDEEVSEAKARRRRLKNRHSARVCSNKKREKCSELTETNKSLGSRINRLESENRVLRSENLALKEQNAGFSKAYTENTQETAQLRQQVAELAQMLVNAGLLPCVDDAAALAA